MSDAVEKDPKNLHGKERDAAMFLDWYQGMSQTDIAKKYGITRQRVSVIKKSKKWDKNANKLTDLQYSKIGQKWKKMSLEITSLLDNDLKRFVEVFNNTPNVTLSKDERQHLRMMFDSLNKITRLVEDKPTDIIENQGVVEHRVILHPQATHWGVIPPPDDVKIIEADKTKEAEEEADFDLLTDMD